MKAAVVQQYGGPEVIQYRDVEKPIPGPRDLLIKVYATPINFGDLMARNFPAKSKTDFNMPGFLLFPVRLMFGYSTPKVKILGSEFAGKVEAVGADVTRFKTGDDVFGYTGMKMGANAEYLCINEEGMVALKPKNMTFPEASAIAYGGLMASGILARVNIKSGDKVLILGASGGIGSIALQMIKARGGVVTGVVGGSRIDYVKALGADKVINYRKEDFTKNGEKYDLILDILGKSDFAQCKDSLTPEGTYLLASFKMKHLLQMLRTKISGKQKVICAMASEKIENLRNMKTMAEEGNIKTIIDRTFPLEKTAEAHRYIESDEKKGSVILEVVE